MSTSELERNGRLWCSWRPLPYQACSDSAGASSNPGHRTCVCLLSDRLSPRVQAVWHGCGTRAAACQFRLVGSPSRQAQCIPISPQEITDRSRLRSIRPTAAVATPTGTCSLVIDLYRLASMGPRRQSGGVRMTPTTLAVLRVFIEQPDDPLYGLEVGRAAGVRSGDAVPDLGSAGAVGGAGWRVGGR